MMSGQTPSKRRQDRNASVRAEYTPRSAAVSARSGKGCKGKRKAEPRRKLAPSSLDRLLEGTGSYEDLTDLDRDHVPLPSFPSMKAVPNMKRRFGRT